MSGIQEWDSIYHIRWAIIKPADMSKKKGWLGILFIPILFGGAMCTPVNHSNTQTPPSSQDTIKLPAPLHDSETSLEAALIERRSVRDYTDEPLSLAEISQLLWAAQGITHPNGYRTAPSAGALYPLEVYLVSGNVIDLPPGVYRYTPQKYELVKIREGDIRSELSRAALNQKSVEQAAAIIVITAVYERTTVKYGDRGIQYVHMEVGSVAQNVYLQAVSLDLGTVFIGAFHDEDVRAIVGFPANEHPLGIIPIGNK
jgi:SagB-type dehydrogenase family enzyme